MIDAYEVPEEIEAESLDEAEKIVMRNIAIMEAEDEQAVTEV